MQTFDISLGIMFTFHFFILLVGCTNARRAKRVVGGEPAKQGQFPFYALLVLPDETFTAYFCGGSLIHPQWILSAADCFPNSQESVAGIERLGLSDVYTVYMGSIDSISPNSVEKLYIHPDFHIEEIDGDWNITSNIALVRLRWQYNLTDLVNSVYLPWAGNPIERCKIGRVVSVGPTSWYDGNTRRVLHFVLVRVKNGFNDVKHPSPTMFYSQAMLESRHVLADDVGAPFVCYPDPENEDEVIQYGVIAGAVNTTKGVMITFIEDVQKHMDFIRAYVPELRYYTKKPIVPYNVSARIQNTVQRRNNSGAPKVFPCEAMVCNFVAILKWFMGIYSDC